jgi:hypothetical protein
MWSDADSGVVTDMTSDFESITSSNYAFREEGGRRYFSPGAVQKLRLGRTQMMVGFTVLRMRRITCRMMRMKWSDCRIYSIASSCSLGKIFSLRLRLILP